MDFEGLLKLMVTKKASDLFITAGVPPSIKIHGKVMPVTQRALNPEKAREVLEVILDHYAEAGYQELEGRDILALPKFERFGGPVEIISNRFGNGEEYDKAIIEVTKELYSEN